MGEEFAKFQVLPKSCRPLADWPETGFAQVAEELRNMMVGLLYPRAPVQMGSQHGQWLLKLRGQSGVDSRERAQRVVASLRELTEDFTISLQATATTQIADSEKVQLGLMLVLTGTPEAFTMIDKAQKDGRLAGAIDEDVVSFYAVYGATVQGSSSVSETLDVEEIEGRDLLVRPGRKIEPAHLVGLQILARETGNRFSFKVHKGDTALQGEEKAANYSQLISYFREALAIPDGHQWVNLSAYESDRMLPRELSGTSLGRVFLSQDCMLKRLTASLMHPDSSVGRDYWNAVYAESQRRFGMSNLPFLSFQKVWMMPDDAVVFEPDPRAELTDDVCSGLVRSLAPDLQPDQLLGIILKSHIDVRCEQDLLARRSHSVAAVIDPNHTDDIERGSDFTLDLFKEIILPALREEVNEGEHFQDMRRAYSAMVLATWIKKAVTAGKIRNEEIRRNVDTGDPKLMEFGQLRIGPLGSSFEIDHATPSAPAFAIPENVEFYQQYVRLFKEGVFRCARSEEGDQPGERVIRVYFSGAVDFTRLGDVVTQSRNTV
jgi:hypothetical protein